MRVVLTTVDEARVTINGRKIAEIGKGFLMLVGFTDGDNKETVEKLVDKILSLRVFPDEHGNINISLDDVKGEILSVSQFTLYADVVKGRRPSFINALKPGEAEPLYDYFNELITLRHGPISTGIFGADMKVSSVNDGPFTLIIDSKDFFK